MYILTRWIRVISCYLSALYLGLALLGFENDKGMSFLVLMSILSAICLDTSRRSIEIAINTTLVFLFVVPAIAALYFGESDHTPVVASSYLFFSGITLAAARTDGRRRSTIGKAAEPRQIDFLVFWSSVLLALINPFFFGELPSVGMLSFLIPFAISLLFLERLCKVSSRLKVMFFLLAYAVVISSYVTFHWSGFGRIVIGALFLMPVLVAHSVRSMHVYSWQAVVLAVPLLYIGHRSRHGETSLSQIHEGSASHHMTITREMWDSLSSFPPDWYEFINQWMLFFLNWFPRDLWQSKPIGVGQYFVDEWIGRVGFAEGFSVSVGFLGELMYYLGHQAWLGLLISGATLIFTRCIVSRVSRGYVTPLVAFDVSLMSYAWGGFATFGSRYWFLLFPMLIVLRFLAPSNSQVGQSHFRNSRKSLEHRLGG